MSFNSLLVGAGLIVFFVIALISLVIRIVEVTHGC